MRLPRILITAPSSGSGKTLVTCGIMEALKRRGLAVAAFKCGPDYIDPMFHKTVLDLPSKNLDSFLADEATLRQLFVNSAKNADISVIEGVMGYYDGMGFDTARASSWEVANLTKTPAILVLNAKGMSLSAVAAIKGFLDLEENSGIKGVILNRVTKMTYMQLAPVIEGRLGIKVLGFVPEASECRFESRHLGLVTPAEIADIRQRLSKMADLVEENVDIDLLLKIAEEAELLEKTNIEADNTEVKLQESVNTVEKIKLQESGNIIKKIKLQESGNIIKKIKLQESANIAVAKDEAFCFYYEDNMELLRKLGAKLQYFSPLRDKKLPSGCNGILLGGGYPEIYAKTLSENVEMLQEIRTAYENKMPIVAECGGFLYLHREIEDLEHRLYKMAGIIDAKAVYTGKLSRFGYIDINLTKKQLYGKCGDHIRGHEFHYYDSDCNGKCAMAVKPSKKRQWECINGSEFFEAGFPHLYYYSNIEFAKNFVEACAGFSAISQ